MFDERTVTEYVIERLNLHNMKIQVALLLFLAGFTSLKAAITYSAEISIFPDAGSSGEKIELIALISVSEVASPNRPRSTATDFRVESVTYEGDFSQTFANLDNPFYYFSIVESFNAFDFESTLPLPDGILGSSETLVFSQGISNEYSPAVPAPFTSFEATDFEVFFQTSEDFEVIGGGGGSIIFEEPALEAFATNSSFDPNFEVPNFGQFESLTVVPEPSSTLLGVIALSFSMRRRRRPC